MSERAREGGGPTQGRRFRFGLTVNQAASGAAWRDLARRAEAAGYSSFLVSDHVGDQLAPVPALASAAEVTEHLRVGMLVACNDFRAPVFHAKDLATLDLLSDGRVEWGIGAGWLKPEYERAGIPFDSGGVRVDRMIEAVAVMRGLFTGEPLRHEGRHYIVSELAGRPRPVQRPHPPLLVGGSQRRMLTFAGRAADIVGVAPSLDARRILGRPPLTDVVTATDRQLAWIREAADARFDELEVNMVASPIAVTGDREAAAAKIAERQGMDPAEVLASPHAWIGTVDEICAQLEAARERWHVSYWVVPAMMQEPVAEVVTRMSGA